MNKTIYIASDHRGFPLKKKFIVWLRDHGYEPVDLGTNSEESCNAMDFAQRLAEELRANPSCRGILICMSGQAMTMTANRYKHIRAALCANTTMARLAREHNDANVLTLGAYIVGEEVALNCLETFLTTDCLGGRFATRNQMLTDLGGL